MLLPFRRVTAKPRILEPGGAHQPIHSLPALKISTRLSLFVEFGNAAISSYALLAEAWVLGFFLVTFWSSNESGLKWCGAET